MTSRSGWGSFSRAEAPSACRKTTSDHSHRRTAVKASENVTVAFPGQLTPPRRFAAGNAAYSSVTTVYRPNRHGAARSTVPRHQPRVVSGPRWARISWNVVPMFHRPVYSVMISGGFSAGSVVEKYSSRCVPLSSRTNPQRSGARPWPDLYQWPVPLLTATRRVPPPYQPTLSRRSRRAPATAALGLGKAPPLTRGPPLPL